MKKKLFIGIFILVIIFILFFYKSCSSKREVSFIVDGKIVSKNTIKDNKVIKPNIPVKEGYKFIGWYYNNKLFDFKKKINKSIILEARWEKVDFQEKIYTVRFLIDGDLIKSETTKDHINKPDMLEKEGYEFVGWYLDGKLFDFNTKIEEDINLKGYYKKKEALDNNTVKKVFQNKKKSSDKVKNKEDKEAPIIKNIDILKTTNSIKINVEARDNSGEVYYEYKVDNGNYQSINSFNQLIHNKKYKVVIKVYDKYGNTRIVEKEVKTNELKINYKLSTKELTKDSVVVDFEKDNNNIYYSNDGINYLKIEDKLDISENKVLYVKKTDGVNTVVDVIKIENIDKEKPNITKFDIETSTKMISIDASATDNYGEVTYKYKLNDGNYQKSNIFDNLNDNTLYEVEIQAIDKVGNVSNSKKTIQTKKLQGPILSLSNSTFTNDSVFVTVDNINSNVKCTYSYGEIKDKEYKDPIKLDENTTLKVKFSDGYNEKVTSISVTNIDKEKPVINNLSLVETTRSIKATINALDNLSGIDTYSYYIDDELKYKGTNQTYLFDNLISNKEYNIKVEVKDKAGNINTYKNTIKTKQLGKIVGIVDKEEYAKEKRVTIKIDSLTDGNIYSYLVDTDYIKINNLETDIILRKDKEIKLKVSDGYNEKITKVIVDKIDNKAPEVIESKLSVKSHEISVELNAIDKGNPTASGIKGYQYKLMLADSTIVKDYTELTTKSKYTFKDVNSSTSYKIGVKVIDNLLNEVEYVTDTKETLVGCFTVTSNGVITDYLDSCDKKLVIPKKFNGITITEIGDGVFFNKGIKSLELHDGIKKIGNNAFYQNPFNETDKLEIPSSVEEIGTYAFANITDGTNKLNATIRSKYLGDTSFAGNLFKNLILDGVETIGKSTFRACRIENITIKEGLKKIDSHAFRNARMKNIILPKSLETIGSSAFQQVIGPLNINIKKPNNSITGAPWGNTTGTINWNYNE